ncbi:MAG TPA: ABC transporter substrate-binding protein [Trebonia sp.]|nr:ABC transporter substrate-binding protein [Trebonia sp.]
MHHKRHHAWLAAATIVTVAATVSACGSAKSASSGSSKSPASSSPITLGLLSSFSGSAISYASSKQGVEARLGLQNAEGGVGGHQLKLVTADDQSSSAGAESGAKQLIQQDNVFGVLDVSAFFSSAAPLTKAAGTPVTGVSFDGGSEWQNPSYTNIFDTLGYADYTIASSTAGAFFKSQGGTKIAAVGYGSAPASANAAKLFIDSAQAAGLSKGLLSTNLAFGSTDVGPTVQAIKASGSDVLYMGVVPSTAFAIIVGLKQAGVRMKAILLPTGYGGDLLNDKATLADAEGVDFITFPAPVELNTAATKQFQAALAKYAGVTSVPTFGEYLGWLTADLFIKGLQAAGPAATQAKFISSLRASSWNAGGLMKTTNFADLAPVAGGNGPGNCFNVVQLQGAKFVPLSGSVPICGSILPGIKIPL